MAIEFVCPACREALRVTDETAGRVVRCGSCQATLRVPTPPPGPDVPPAPGRRQDPEPLDPPRSPDRGGRDLDEYGEPRPRRRRRPPRPAGRGVLFWVLILFLFGGVLMAAACGGLLLLVQAKWRPYQSERGGFAVELPADPRPDMAELAKTNNQPNLKVEGTLLVGKLEEYSVVYTDVEPATRQLLTDDAILDEAVKGLKKDTDGLEVIRDDPATVSGFPAREVAFTHPTGGTYLCRIVIADTRLYIVTAGGPWVTAAGNNRIRRYLDSFRVTDPKLLKKPKDRPADDTPRRPRKRPRQED